MLVRRKWDTDCWSREKVGDFSQRSLKYFQKQIYLDTVQIIWESLSGLSNEEDNMIFAF